MTMSGAAEVDAAAASGVTGARAEWRAHWKLVAASTIGGSLMGLGVTSFGAFIAPLEQTFGWTRAEVTAGLTIFAFAGVLFSPLLGGVVDRWGPRRFGVPGVLLAGAAFALFSTATPSILYWGVLWFIYSAIAQIPRPMIWSAAVASEFKASRGLALSVVLAGASFGALVSPVLAGYLIDAIGWRTSYVAIGLGWGGVAWVVSYFFFHSRADQVGRDAARKDSAAGLPGVTAREGLTSFLFLRFALATLIAYTSIMAVLIHTIPLLTETGLSRSNATWLAGLTSFAAVFGVLIAGALADRMPGHYLYGAFLGVIVVAWPMLLINTDSVVLRLIPLLMQGIAGGAQSHLLPYVTTRYFGLRAFGVIFGVISSIMAIGIGLGPLLGGYIHDRTHNYNQLLMLVIPAVFVAAVLILSLGRYPAEFRKAVDG
jgi:MFS family permease